jgi:general transcription factor 3C polypeptide 5 (transcription factor C subunit 1)
LLADGWFRNGTMAKAKVIMRAKIQRILEGREYSDVEFGRLLAIPEEITEMNKKGSALIAKGASSEELTWASRIRAWALKPSAGSQERATGLGEERIVGLPGKGKGDERLEEESVADEVDDVEEEVEDEELENMEDDEDEDGEDDDAIASQVEDVDVAEEEEEEEEEEGGGGGGGGEDDDDQDMEEAD